MSDKQQIRAKANNMPAQPQHRPAPAPRPDEKPAADKAPVISGSDLAPVIMFDGVIASGGNNGIVQIEVAMNHILPVQYGKPDARVKIVVTGHLRCSALAARNLYDVLRQLLMIDEQATPEKSKQN